MTTYTLTIDGGCLDNQHADNASAYYSMMLAEQGKGECVVMTLDGVPMDTTRILLPSSSRQTNQVAELYAYIQALTYLVQLKTRCQASGVLMPAIAVQNDSEYARNFVTGYNRKSRDNMDLVKQIQALVAQLADCPVTYVHINEQSVKRIIGH